MALGGWIGGAIYVIAGSYDVAILLSLLFSIGGAAVILSMAPTGRILIPNWEESLPAQARSEEARPAGAD